jgi:hypothetical protein
MIKLKRKIRPKEIPTTDDVQYVTIAKYVPLAIEDSKASSKCQS